MPVNPRATGGDRDSTETLLVEGGLAPGLAEAKAEKVFPDS